MEEVQLKYSGFWRRFLAHVIDQFVLSFFSIIIFIPIFAIFGLSIFSLFNINESSYNLQVGYQFDSEDATIAAITIFIISILVLSFISGILQWLYYALMESSAKQGTLGKMALGIIVTDMNGGRITFGRASGRYFGKILSGMILYIGFIMAGFTEKKQALHDILANCLVVDK